MIRAMAVRRVRKKCIFFLLSFFWLGGLVLVWLRVLV